MTEAEKPLRIRFPLEGLNRSGGIRILTQIAGGLAARGHQVRVIVPRYASKDRFGLDERVELYVVSARFRVLYVLWLLLFSARDCDVCFATGYKTPFYLRISSMFCRSRARLIYLIQHYEPLSHVQQVRRPGIIRTILFRFARWSYRLRLQQVAVSAWIRDRIGDPSILVFPDGVDIKTFCPAGISPGHAERIVVGVLGRHETWKGYDVFCRAVESVRDDVRRRLRVEIVSHESLPVPRSVEARFLAPSSDAELRDFYRGCDIFVFPSLMEGFGLPALEAMACGVAVIVSDCGGVREFAEPGNSLLVPAGDVAALASAIERLVDDVGLRRRLGAGGLETAREFSLEAMVQRYASLIERS